MFVSQESCLCSSHVLTILIGLACHPVTVDLVCPCPNFGVTQLGLSENVGYIPNEIAI